MKMMSITCYALMFLLVTTKLHYVLIIADSDFIEEFAMAISFFEPSPFALSHDP